MLCSVIAVVEKIRRWLNTAVTTSYAWDTMNIIFSALNAINEVTTAQFILLYIQDLANFTATASI